MTDSFRAARHAIAGDSWLDDLSRASLLAAETKFSPRPEAVPALRVSMPDLHDLDVYTSYILSKAVQDATAKIGHVLRNPRSEVAAVYPSDREKARLFQRGQSGAMILFGFPSNTPDPTDNYLTEPVETLAERAAQELLNVLPRSSDDDDALDAVLAQRPTVRNAINDIVNAIPSQTERLDFTLTRGTGETVDSVLSAEQAMVLKGSLSETNRVVSTVTMAGRLDGVRTKRRIFYLELETGKDIYGAIDIEQLDGVRRNLDRQVIVTLQEERIRFVTGKQGRPHYRLMRIDMPENLF